MSDSFKVTGLQLRLLRTAREAYQPDSVKRLTEVEQSLESAIEEAAQGLHLDLQGARPAELVRRELDDLLQVLSKQTLNSEDVKKALQLWTRLDQLVSLANNVVQSSAFQALDYLAQLEFQDRLVDALGDVLLIWTPPNAPHAYVAPLDDEDTARAPAAEIDTAPGEPIDLTAPAWAAVAPLSPLLREGALGEVASDLVAKGAETKKQFPVLRGAHCTTALITDAGDPAKYPYNEDGAAQGILRGNPRGGVPEVCWAGVFDQAGGMGRDPSQTGAASGAAAEIFNERLSAAARACQRGESVDWAATLEQAAWEADAAVKALNQRLTAQAQAALLESFEGKTPVELANLARGLERQFSDSQPALNALGALLAGPPEALAPTLQAFVQEHVTVFAVTTWVGSVTVVAWDPEEQALQRTAHTLSIGDSRATLCRANGEVRGTPLDNKGAIDWARNPPRTAADAVQHLLTANVVTNAIGGLEACQVLTWTLQAGDRLLLATDGPFDANERVAKKAVASGDTRWHADITQAELAEVVREAPSAEDAADAVRRYTVDKQENGDGKLDNNTCVVLEVR